MARVLRRADRRLKTPRSMELVDALAFSAAGTVLEHDLRKPYRQGQERAVH